MEVGFLDLHRLARGGRARRLEAPTARRDRSSPSPASSAVALTFIVSARTDESRWPASVRALERFLRTARNDGSTRLPSDVPRELVPLAESSTSSSLEAISRTTRPARPFASVPLGGPASSADRVVDDAKRTLRGAGMRTRRDFRPAAFGQLFDDGHGQSPRAGRVALDRVQPGGAGIPRLDARRPEEDVVPGDRPSPRIAARRERPSSRPWSGARRWA